MTTCEAYDVIKPDSSLEERKCKKPASIFFGWSPHLKRYAALCDGHVRGYKAHGFVVHKDIPAEETK